MRWAALYRRPPILRGVSASQIRADHAANQARINARRKYMNKHPMKKYKIAVLDDYQNVALETADWSVLRDRADITVFRDHLADPDAVIERLLPFDVICVMRERPPLPRNAIERRPNLKLIAATGSGSAS